MLGKLLKYDFKAIGRILLPIFGATLIIAIVNGVWPWAESFATLGSVMGTLAIGRIIAMFLFFAAAAFCGGLCFIAAALRFRNVILGSEGYLFNTLPIHPITNVFAQLIAAVVFQILGLFVLFLSSSFFSGSFSVSDLKNVVLNFLGIKFMGDVKLQIILYVIIILAITLVNVAVYTSLSIGHSFNGGKKIISVAAFTVLFIVGAYVFYILSDKLFGLGLFYSTLATGIYLAALLLLYNIVGLVITNYFISRRLNLE